MEKEEVRSALVWLKSNGYEKEVKDFFDCLDAINLFAITNNFSDDPTDWSSILQRKCRKMQKLDSLYFKEKNEHIFRTFNALDKEDMLDWIHEINRMVKF